ncbi:MAG: FixH family protein [Proteobacteria bacterium]|nr:FixH family protein [Pseudomonadota bacterium]
MSATLTGRHVLTILLVSFGVIFAVNGFFAYVAVQSFPGLESDRAYRKGLAFNDQVARTRALDNLGWSLATDLGADRVLTLTFTDRNSGPLAIDTLAVTLFHPTAARDDTVLKPAPAGRGVFIIPLADTVKGQRELRIAATAPNGQAIEFRRKLWVD